MTVKTEQLLDVSDLVVRYHTPGKPAFTAVNGVSFSVERGETVGLVGESGCGKSTIAKALSGMVKPASGELRFHGEAISPLTFRRRSLTQSRLQMVFQDPYNSLNPRRSVGAQIADGIRLATSGDVQTPQDWLERVGLHASDASKYPHQFSGGQRQRVAIARALAAQPLLLIGDEPISALDASLQSQIAELMRELALEANSGMLFISHDLAVVRSIADRILVMRRGEIVESGPTEQVWNDPQHPYTRLLLSSIPLPDGLGRLPGLPESELEV